MPTGFQAQVVKAATRCAAAGGVAGVTARLLRSFWDCGAAVVTAGRCDARRGR